MMDDVIRESLRRECWEDAHGDLLSAAYVAVTDALPCKARLVSSAHRFMEIVVEARGLGLLPWRFVNLDDDVQRVQGRLRELASTHPLLGEASVLVDDRHYVFPALN